MSAPPPASAPATVPKGSPTGTRPALPETQPDLDDPAVREEMRHQRAERRKKLDTNHDGIVSDEEERAGWRGMIERLDENHDGKLGFDELKKERRYERVLQANIDTDNDGVISIEELDAFARHRREWFRSHWGSDAE